MSAGFGSGSGSGSGGSGSGSSSGSGAPSGPGSGIYAGGSEGGPPPHQSAGERRTNQPDDRQSQNYQLQAEEQRWQERQILANLPALEAQYAQLALAAGGGSGYFGPPELIDPRHPTPISQGFGCTQYEFEPFDAQCSTKHFHTGDDIAGPYQVPVFASDSGIAAVFSSPYGYGTYAVVTDGNGYQTLYGHLDKALVTTGDVVHRGDILGLEGSSGNSTGPHLHFEIRYHGAFVDPCAELDCGGHGYTASELIGGRVAVQETSAAGYSRRFRGAD